MDYASRGFICLAIYHTDESCVYTQKKDGTPVYLEATDNTDLSRWNTKTEIRIKDINSVYNDLASHSKSLFEGVLDFVQVDLDHLYIMGHSAGGLSAYHAAQRLGKDKCKAVCLLDGANAPAVEAPKDPQVPLITINSVIGLDWLCNEIGGHDLKKIRREMQEANTSGFSENWWSDKHGHLDFSD